MDFYLAVVFFYATAEPDIRYQQFHSFQRCVEHRQSVLGSRCIFGVWRSAQHQ
jgi:hypothetical protein